MKENVKAMCILNLKKMKLRFDKDKNFQIVTRIFFIKKIQI